MNQFQARCCQASAPAGREEGSILIMAVVVTVIIMLVLGQTATTAVADGRKVQYDLAYLEALALADGTTESAQKRLLEETANFLPVTTTGLVTVDGEAFEYFATPIGSEITRIESDGFTQFIQPYELTATVTSDAAVVHSNRVVDLTKTPVFQFMILYNDDLEILPGPDMTLGGRVHSNGSIYLGAGSTLTVDTDYFRATGDILRERKNDGSTTGGTVNIREFETTNFVNMTNTMDADNASWTSLAMEQWGGTVQDGSHGVTEAVVPEIGSIGAFDPVSGDKGYYHENADLVIVDGQAYDTNDNPVSLPAGTITETQMWDGREGQYVTVTEIDMELLNGSGAFPANGLIYAYRSDTTAANPNGIRLTNGAELLAPLSVVTEDPLYIQGDYNTVDKKGASVMCDALNLLSNAWDDSKGPGSLPGASDTTYNVAVVTGNVPTPDGGGSYSGGFENLPRFHENWTGVDATIRGSFIKIFESQFARSPWSYGGDVYTAPVRDWEYDPDLLGAGNLPPFTPNAVMVRRVMWSDGLPLPFLSSTPAG